MTFTVFYERFFEEYGENEMDTREFDNLSEAYSFYNEMKETTKVELWVKNTGDVGYGSQIA